MPILIFFVSHWYLSLFSQTFFQHRYAAHGAFSMNKVWERVFYLFTFITQGSSFISPRGYAIMHRMHHAYTDTDKDPHSPQYDSNLFAMMWRTKNIYQSILKDTNEVEARFLKNLPNWPALERLGDSWIIRLLWVLLYTLFYFYFASSYWMFLLLPVHILMGPIHGAIINWFAHKYQYVNFKVNNTSKNLFPVDLLMMGEAYHNNHHKFPSNINFGFRWHEVDPTYPVILFLQWLRIVKVKKLAAHSPVTAQPQLTE
ncbi:MAG: acyl-CoA desaturase [Chitinophagaceae bacterium]